MKVTYVAQGYICYIMHSSLMSSEPLGLWTKGNPLASSKNDETLDPKP